MVSCACSTSSDVVGPFTGAHHRFVIDRITLPVNPDDEMRFGDDLNGGGEIDNNMAPLIQSLDGFGGVTSHAADMIASGALASEIEIVANDLTTDDTVAVLYHGVPGDRPTPVGGRLLAGAFAPNRTRDTRVPGEAVIRWPLFADADPIAVRVVGLEIMLTSDGAGGFDGIVAGGFLLDELMEAATAGLMQMIATNPQDHVFLANTSDHDHDGVLSPDEAAWRLSVARYSLDLQLFNHGRFGPVEPHDGPIPDSISLGFAIHLTPCASGRCSTSAPADPCHDRVRDGDETDVDCGGSCGRCPAAFACLVPGDCQTAACDAGRCRAPSCSDGIVDGFESDLDCGGNCGGCALGKGCSVEHDCAVGSCSGVFSNGTCQEGQSVDRALSSNEGPQPLPW